MKKALGSWSGMRKYLEKEMLADCLRGRVRYNCTRYVGMDDCHIYEIFVDGKLVRQFSWETVNSWFLRQGMTEIQDPYGIREYWAEFWRLLEATPMDKRTEYTDGEFCDALAAYRNQKIGQSLASENPLVRMFAILDRRVGKRTLEKLEPPKQPEWLARFYALRREAESVRSN